MRLSLIILLLLFAVTNKANKTTHGFNGDVVHTEIASQEAGIYDNTRGVNSKPNNGSKIKTGVPFAFGFILHSYYLISFTAIENHHTSGTLFFPLSRYSILRSCCSKPGHCHEGIVNEKKLMIIYPYHSFW